MRVADVLQRLDHAQRWPAIALGFSIPISVALDNVLLLALLLLWLAGGRYREKWRSVSANPVALAALALWAWLALSLAWSGALTPDSLRAFNKYSDLLYLALLVWPMRERETRRLALRAFSWGCALTLLASYALYLGLVPPSSWLHGDSGNPAAFKLHLTHNILMAAAAFLYAQLARHAQGPRLRLLYAALAAAAVFNVLFMVQGRTGYLVLAVLIVAFVAGEWRGRRLLAAAALAIALFSVAYATSPPLHQRIGQGLAELSAWRAGQAVAADNSIGLRLEFYRNTINLVREHPLLGVGAGGFASAYAERVNGTGMVATRNPHNQYLLLAAQGGAVGLALFVYLLYAQWRFAPRLPGGLERNLARGLVLTMALACLLNSLLIDHTEGLYFAWLSALLFGGLSAAPAEIPAHGQPGTASGARG